MAFLPEKTLTEMESEMEEHLILLTEDPDFPEPKNARFELWGYDGEVKTLFLRVDDKFTSEHRTYIKNKLRPFFNRKLVIGLIRIKDF